MTFQSKQNHLALSHAANLFTKKNGNSLGNTTPLDSAIKFGHSSFMTRKKIGTLRDRNDNSFRRATDLGTVRPGRSFSFKAKNTVGPKDPVDYYKLTVSPGIEQDEISSTLRISAKKGGIKIEGFVQFGSGSIKRAGTQRVLPGSPFVDDGTVWNNSPKKGTIYFKITPLNKGNSDYTLNLFGEPVDDSFDNF